MSLAKTVNITSGAETRALSSRRKLFGGAAAMVLGTGITAGVAASAADLVPAELEPDAELLSLRSELMAAVAELGWSEIASEVPEHRLTEVANRLIDASWAIVDAPSAQTAAGRALKAAAAMYHLRDGFSSGEWPGCGEAIAWDALSEVAGDFYGRPLCQSAFVF